MKGVENNKDGKLNEGNASKSHEGKLGVESNKYKGGDALVNGKERGFVLMYQAVLSEGLPKEGETFYLLLLEMEKEKTTEEDDEISIARTLVLELMGNKASIRPP